jgi:hypothetical protein
MHFVRMFTGKLLSAKERGRPPLGRRAMSLIATLETCCDVGSAVAIVGKADVARTPHFGTD